MSKQVRIKAELSEGPMPEAVRIEVAQGPHTLQTADVPPGESAVFSVDDGDYTARAVALAPHGTPAEAAFAVPLRLVVTEA